MPHLSLAPARRLAPACASLALLVTLASRAAAQGDSVRTPGAHATPAPTAVASPRLGPIVVDGRLDEAAWSKATPITDFTQNDPDEGKPASERTEVRFLYDESALYVGARMYDRNGAAGVTSRLIRRDADSESDWFDVAIDSYHDHLGRAMFELNPAGVKWDAAGTGNVDVSWDPIWEGDAKIDSLGWTAEMRIPYSQLRFSQKEVQTWGMQVTRYIQRRREEARWSFTRKTEFGGPSRFGHLEGLRIASVPRHVEIVPYVVSRSRHIRPAPGDPFNDGNQQDVRFGGDVKAMLTSNLTLDATINPDFGQVEVDPASVNLSAFETFFSEKRPFFVAGSGIFDFGSASCSFCSNFSSVESFYSRRIGRQPQGGVPSGDNVFADVPESATILGAAKITGRTAGGMTVGLLNAVTRRERATVYDGNTQTRSSVDVEPLTNYFVGRATHDYRGGDLVVGGIVTSVARKLDDAALGKLLNKHAEAVGADLVAQWDKKNYQLFATAEITNIAGSPAAILRAQRSSARYYQRPDRSDGRYDPAATRMSGFGGYVRMAKDGGNLNWEAQVNTRTPGFEVNDISFLSRADYVQQIANVSYNWTVPTQWYRNLSVIFGGQRQQTYDGIQNGGDVHFWVGGMTPQFWNVNSWVMRVPRAFDERALRGGPVATSPATTMISANIGSDSRRAVVVSTNPQFQHNDEGGFQSRLNASVRWKPMSNVSVSVGPSYTYSRGVQQYVASVDDAANAAFFGRSYVLSDIVRKEASLDTRVNVTFSPTSTLEVYAQPFISTGAYSNYKEFLAPRQRDKRVFDASKGEIAPIISNGETTGYRITPRPNDSFSFTVPNRDFNLRSLRGNAVYRWEYRPGSTLYVVWTQSREDYVPNMGTFDYTRDRDALFAAHPDNIFLVKVNYWLGR
jgi:hypothetical protein